ncbi:CIA30 family protein [Polaribacter vadi]|uniref:CIA30 family protein n=1 Tax=Polaribacter vadi TaxID=1774273 RepID=UPI0030EF3CD1|tara:strand:+ start:47 stop:544 length:498 start_codon:yes stop_codon:yes gene_type:complete
MNNSAHTIFEFSKQSNISSWKVVDDVVMGGVSSGNFEINEEGNGLYTGEISLENNGGFSSLRYRFDKINVEKFSKVILKIKGDGKKYQFRVKDNFQNYYSYIQTFETSKEWEFVEINLSDMYPAFRGRNLDMSNFSSNEIEEIALLIGNKKEESFRLEISKIYLQ